MTLRESLLTPLSGLSVLELADDPSGELVGRLLAQFGAIVTKFEPPNGAASRHVGPFANGQPDVNASLNFWFYNTDKQSVIARLDRPEGIAALHRGLETSDILISTLQPAALERMSIDLRVLAEVFPRLIVLSVTPFGLTGPWADYKSSDLIALAAGGPLYLCGYDDHSIPPIRPGGNQAYHTAASFAQIALMLALLDRQNTGQGQVIDISMHEACALNVELANPYWFYPRAHIHRQTCRHAQPSPTQPAHFRCADGRYVYFALMLSEQKAWNALTAWMATKGMAAQLTQPEFDDPAYRQKNAHILQDLLECFFLIQESQQAYRDGQTAGLPIGVIAAPEEVLHDPHLKARGFFQEIDEEFGTLTYPGPIYRFSAFGEATRIRAPHLGEHGGPTGRRDKTSKEIGDD